MRELAPLAGRLADRGRPGKVARVVSWKGIGGRRAGEALLLVDEGEVHGSLLGGLAESAVAAASGANELVELPLGDAEAVAAGLACGGTVTLLVSDVANFPAGTWEALEQGGPVALLARPGSPATMTVSDDLASKTRRRLGSLGDEATDEAAEGEAAALLRRGRDSTTFWTSPSGEVVLEAMAPSTTLHVLGSGELVAALSAQAGLLGWSASCYASFDGPAGEALSLLRSSDALVVLTHDHDEATPALAAGLRAGCYVGALGSRHTQQERRRRLEAEGLSAAELARLHGPVGLDLGARSPEETALAVAAEILAARSGRSAASLTGASGPING